MSAWAKSYNVGYTRGGWREGSKYAGHVQMCTGVVTFAADIPCSAVERTRHTYDSRDQILVLAFGWKTLEPFEVFDTRAAAVIPSSYAK